MRTLRKFQFFFFVGVALLASCKERIEVLVPDFDVEMASNSYQVNEEIIFNFRGNPDFISFYSGEIGHDYNAKDGRVVEKGKVELAFRTNVQYGNQADMFSVMASTDFNGDFSNIANVKNATWTNITNRFTLATNTTFLNTGKVDISDIVEDGKPLYIGFKLTVRDADLYGNWRTWRVQGFDLTTETSIGVLPLGDMFTSDFIVVDNDPEGPSKTRSTITTATLTLVPATVTEENRNIGTETWIISRPFNAGKFDAGPDRPVTIKGSITGDTKEYKHIYSTPGNYNAYFVVSNNNIYDVKEVVRKINLTITP